MRKNRNRKSNFVLCAAVVLVVIVVAVVSIINNGEKNESMTFIPLETPSEEPVTEPTVEPSDVLTEKPTEEPTAEPTKTPTEEPTTEPTEEPTEESTEAPTEELTPEPTEKPFDLEAMLADTSYVDEDPEKRGTIFEDRFSTLSLEEKFEVLKVFFPDGKYWNHFYVETDDLSSYQLAMSVTDIPCSNTYGLNACNEYTGMMDVVFKYFYDCQCLGFAGMVSDFLFGEFADIKVIEDDYYTWDDIEVGDQIRFIYADHSAIVCDKDENSITLVECNRDYQSCKIEWGRKLTKEELNAYGFAIIKRVSAGEGDYTYEDYLDYWCNSGASDINSGHGARWS